MNNKLKELLKKINASPEITCANPLSKTCTGCEYDDPKTRLCDVYGRKADYLISQGVIVPTLNPGDVVYIDNHPSVVTSIVIEQKGEIAYVIECDETKGYIEFTDEDIGVIVFLEKDGEE